MEKLYENIENHLLGKLPKKEQEAFIEQIQQDPDLQEEVDAFRIARDVVENNIGEQLRSDFGAWDQESKQATKRTSKIVTMRPRRWKAIAVAACFMLFSYAFMSWYNVNENYNSNTLAMSTFQSMEMVNNNRSPNQIETVLSYGEAAMEAKDYSEAIEQFGNISKNSEYYNDAQLKLAGAYFAIDEIAKTHATLQPLLASENIIIKEKSEWLQLLSLLKEGKKSSPEFKDLLAHIAQDNNHNFHHEAVDLTELLGDFWMQFVR